MSKVIRAFPSQILLVGGNICSGKTTLSQQLAEYFSIPFISIDQFRREYGVGSASSELLAWAKFIEAIELTGSAVVEATTAGPFSHLLKYALKQKNGFVYLYLNTDVDTCCARLSDRGFTTPYPDFGATNEKVLQSIDAELKEKFTVRYWGSAPITVGAENNKKDIFEEVLVQLGSLDN